MQYAIRCQKGGIRDDSKFITDLRAAIEAAPKRDGRDVADYLGEPYLRRIIDGAFNMIGNAAKSAADGTEGAPIKLPAGFGFAKGGLWFTDPSGEAAEPVWVCQQFDLIGKCKDAANIHPGLVLQWQDDDGLGHTWIVPKSLMHGEPKIIAQQLAEQDFTCNYNQHGNLRRCLASLRPERRLTAVERARLAWHELLVARWQHVWRRRRDAATRNAARRSVMRHGWQLAGLAGSGGAVCRRQLAAGVVHFGGVCRQRCWKSSQSQAAVFTCMARRRRARARRHSSPDRSMARAREMARCINGERRAMD